MLLLHWIMQRGGLVLFAPKLIGNPRYSSILTKVVFFSSTGTWPIVPPAEESQGWRHIRLQQNGKNASGQTHYLSLSGFEIYGTVTGVCDDLGMKKNNTQ